MRVITMIFSFVSAVAFSTAYAFPAVEQVQVPLCLASKLKASYPILAENEAFKIIELPSLELDELVKVADRVHCGRFLNVTQTLLNIKAVDKKNAAAIILKRPIARPLRLNATPYTVSHPREVNSSLKFVVEDNIWETISSLSGFMNRSSVLLTGTKTAEWLKLKFEAMAAQYGRKDIKTFFVSTGKGYLQPSLVTVIGADKKLPGIVIGAHMDTLGNSLEERYPGADDDASGSATIMEVARVLLSSNIKLSRPIYIIWYAAEERGLVGSQQVVNYFKEQGIPVYAAIQFDMTGYKTAEYDKTIWVYTDYTNSELNGFLIQLIKTYINVPVKESMCGYACSDHASWTEGGFPATFPAETSFEDHNPFIHQAADTISNLYIEHMKNFAKLGVAFALELAI